VLVDTLNEATRKKLTLLVRIELLLTLIVILGGAFVRATGSGAGCGQHWPLCNGEIIPFAPRVETIIEFTHRLTSGASLLLFVFIFILVRRQVPKAHGTRSWAKVALFSFFLEAGIGALLVLKSLVATNTSYLRAAVISLHLVNTYVLLAGLSGMLWNLRSNHFIKFSDLNKTWRLILGAWCLVGAMGAIVALGDTLFPSTSLAQGIRADLDSGSHLMIRLRFIHPLFALGVAAVTLFFTSQPGNSASVTSAAMAVRLWVIAQIVCGLLNWVFLAPLWLQLVHLLMADLTWILVVRFSLVETSFDSRLKMGLPIVRFSH
jgi:cytochrome c oxidase assembly protein subunit 15